MHMSSDSSDYKKLDGDENLLLQALWARLEPSGWPFSLNDLPDKTVLVGGAIRDSLLGRLHDEYDLDFVVPSGAMQIARNLILKYGGTFVELDPQRDIARWVICGWTIDITSQLGLTLEEDLLRRDFTLNSIALTLGESPRILDPADGLKDLRDKTLKAISQQNLIDDPLRLLRALRFKAQFNFLIDHQTISWIKLHRVLLEKVAPERIQTEITKLLSAPGADKVIPLIRQYGLLNLWIQEEQSVDKSSENLSNAKNFTKEELSSALFFSRLTSLLSDKGLEYLRFSRYQRNICKSLRKWKNHYDGLDYKSLDELDRLILHKELESHLPAIILDISESSQIDWLQRWRDPKDPLFHPSSPVDGNTLQEVFGLSPGPVIGRLLEYLSREKAFGRLLNQQQAFKAARSWLLRNEASL